MGQKLEMGLKSAEVEQLKLSEPCLGDKLEYVNACRVWTWGNGHCFFYGVGMRLSSITPNETVSVPRSAKTLQSQRQAVPTQLQVHTWTVGWCDGSGGEECVCVWARGCWGWGVCVAGVAK